MTLGERFQLAEDNLSDMPANALKGLDYGEIRCWPFLGECYTVGKTALDLVFRIRVDKGRETVTENYFAVFKSTVPLALKNGHPSGGIINDGGLGPIGGKEGSQKPAVFVNVLEFVEKKQRVCIYRVPSIVWLQRFNHFLRRSRSLRNPSFPLSVKLGEAGANWKLYGPLLRRGGIVFMHHKPRQMIQSNSLIPFSLFTQNTI